jgi:hypothetical protein
MWHWTCKKLKILYTKLEGRTLLKIFTIVSLFILFQEVVRNYIFNLFNQKNVWYGIDYFDNLFNLIFDESNNWILFSYLINIGYSVCASIIFYWFMEYKEYKTNILRYLVVPVDSLNNKFKQISSEKQVTKIIFFGIGDIFLTKALDNISTKNIKQLKNDFCDIKKKSMFINQKIKAYYYDFLKIMNEIESKYKDSEYFDIEDTEKIGIFLDKVEKEIKKINRYLLFYIIFEKDKVNRNIIEGMKITIHLSTGHSTFLRGNGF